MNFLNYRKKKFYIDNISIEKLSKKFKTPFYCYSLSQVKLNLDHLKNSFNKIKPLICFSVKSNSNIKILNELKKKGCGADVVSMGEMLAALKAGVHPSKIVFSGVGKTKEELEFAIKNKILLINIESESEAKLINQLSKKKLKHTSVGIRLNPNINAKTIKKITTGLNENKFGLTEKNFLNLVLKIKSFKNLSLECLSVHIGSQILNINPFKKTLKVIERIIIKTNFNFKYIDLGGGIGISYNKAKTLNLKEYAALVEKFTLKHKCKIIFEPGRLIIGNSAAIITKIIYIKKTQKKDFIILDSGMNDLIRPALYNARHSIVPIKKNKYKYKKTVEFVGPICESSDKFLSSKNYQQIKENDILLILDVGAYGMSLSSNYCFRPKLAEILIDKNKIKIVRKKENLKNLLK